MNEDLGQDVADARRRFDEACNRIRPELHRFCTRMTGSPCDGEDVLQEALVLAFYRLAELRDERSFRPWIFRIAHNKCIDFLRAARHFDPIDEERAEREGRTMDEVFDQKERVERALANIVTDLPPKERACIVLKDLLDWSLEETAEIVGSNVGAVKTALHRGRVKLEKAEQMPGKSRRLEPEHRALVERYLAAFNRRDWDAVQALLAEEARLEVVHQFEGAFHDACYFINYGRLSLPWKLALAEVDGVESIVHFRETDGVWMPRSVVQLGIASGRIARVRDYVHVEYMLRYCVVK